MFFRKRRRPDEQSLAAELEVLSARGIELSMQINNANAVGAIDPKIAAAQLRELVSISERTITVLDQLATVKFHA